MCLQSRISIDAYCVLEEVKECFVFNSLECFIGSAGASRFFGLCFFSAASFVAYLFVLSVVLILAFCLSDLTSNESVLVFMLLCLFLLVLGDGL